jgi:hypothetical protein
MTNDPVTQFVWRPLRDTEHTGLCDDPLLISSWWLSHHHGQSSLKSTTQRPCLQGYQIQNIYVTVADILPSY